jgi:hypothetical protein
MTNFSLLLRVWDSNPRHSAYETELEPTPVQPAMLLSE